MSVACGRLEVICGPMFAGKTSMLLTRLEEARGHGRSVVALKPALDTRYDASRIVTHDGRATDADLIGSATDLPRAAGNADVVAIDEVHFFEESFAESCGALVACNRRVIVAGVDLDHHGLPFAVMARLAELADEVTTLAAKCTQCGAAAHFTQRLIDSDARIAVGGSGDYEPRCATCFEGGAEGKRERAENEERLGHG